MSKMTAIKLELLLKAFYRADNYIQEFSRNEKLWYSDLVKLGLVFAEGGVTAKGHAHVHQILNLKLPVPVQAFTLANGELFPTTENQKE